MKTTQSLGYRFKTANLQKMEGSAKPLSTTHKAMIGSTEPASCRTLEAARTVKA